MRFTTVVALILVIAGAINWLLIGLVDFNLVYFICFKNMLISRIIYSLVGLGGLWMIFYSYFYKPLSNVK